MNVQVHCTLYRRRRYCDQRQLSHTRICISWFRVHQVITNCIFSTLPTFTSIPIPSGWVTELTVTLSKSANWNLIQEMHSTAFGQKPTRSSISSYELVVWLHNHCAWLILERWCKEKSLIFAIHRYPVYRPGFLEVRVATLTWVR